MRAGIERVAQVDGMGDRGDFPKRWGQVDVLSAGMRQAFARGIIERSRRLAHRRLTYFMTIEIL